MVNLINDYGQEVEPKHWQQLCEAAHEAADRLRKRIAESPQPIVKRKAAKALDLLLAALHELARTTAA